MLLIVITRLLLLMNTRPLLAKKNYSDPPFDTATDATDADFAKYKSRGRVQERGRRGVSMRTRDTMEGSCQ